MHWASDTFKEPRTLADGQTYHLILKSPTGGGNTACPIEFGDFRGFTAGNFKDGYFEQTTDGKVWQRQSGEPSRKQELYFLTVKAPQLPLFQCDGRRRQINPPELSFCGNLLFRSADSFGKNREAPSSHCDFAVETCQDTL